MKRALRADRLKEIEREEQAQKNKIRLALVPSLIGAGLNISDFVKGRDQRFLPVALQLAPLPFTIGPMTRLKRLREEKERLEKKSSLLPFYARLLESQA